MQAAAKVASEQSQSCVPAAEATNDGYDRATQTPVWSKARTSAWRMSRAFLMLFVKFWGEK